MEKKFNLSPEQKKRLLKTLNLNLEKNNTEAVIQVDFAKPYGFRLSKNTADIRAENFIPSPPGPYQIQIEAKAISLNFRDIMIALGLYPQGNTYPIMGGDYAGIVAACGKEVSSFEVGDEVISIYSGELDTELHFNSYINAYEPQVVKKPSHLTFEEACCIPTVFLTAYLGLCVMGNLDENEKVLIHNASGGVGLAAIQIAKWYSSEIFATAGTKEKIQYLNTLGIRNIMDSRSLEFYEEVLNQTNGRGIDVILNTLSGEAIEKGMQLLKTFGRFIHIGKSDIANKRMISLDLFKNSSSFIYFDISHFFMNSKLKKIFQEIINNFVKGIFNPLPYKKYSSKDVSSAINYMSLSKHIGKIVLEFGK